MSWIRKSRLMDRFSVLTPCLLLLDLTLHDFDRAISPQQPFRSPPLPEAVCQAGRASMDLSDSGPAFERPDVESVLDEGHPTLDWWVM